MIRAFVAIGLPREIATVLEKAQGGLHTGRLTAPGDFHITLAFLGEHIDPVIGALRKELAAVAAGPFYLNINGVGTFGGSTPRAVFAEVEAARGLKTLHRMVGRAVRQAGLELSHERYAPHVTLARFDELATHDLKQIMSFLSRRVSLKAGPFPVTDFMLYASHPDADADGPRYEVLESYPLTGR